jgi:hypothetical protein
MIFWLVIGFNGLLTVFNVYLVLRLLHWRQDLLRLTRTLIYLNRRTHRTLYLVPTWVMQGQESTARLKLVYSQLGEQLWRCRPWLALVVLGVRYSRRRTKPSSASIWSLLGNLNG